MKIFLGFCIVFLCCHSVMANDVVVWDTSQDNVTSFYGVLNRILDGVVLTAPPDNPVIGVMESMDIENYGTINGSLVAYNENYIHINNTGTITGEIIAQHVIQIITSGAGAKRLNVISPDFSVKVSGATDGVLLNDIQNLGTNSVEFNGSMIIIENFSDWQNWDANVSWLGVNTLSINNVHTVNSGTYVRHASGATILNVLSADEDKMYRIDAVHDAYGIMLNVVRETNYQRIFDDNRGIFLDNIRIYNQNDKMLIAMDSAKTMDDLQNIMNSSYRFNPSLLLRPLKSMNKISMMDDLFGDSISGIGIVPWYSTSDSTQNAGALIYANINHGDNDLKFALHLNKFEYEDDFNDFGGMVYGLNARAKRRMDKFSIVGNLGFDFINFDADNIYSETGAINNPSGYSLYSRIHGIYDYNVFNNLFLSPFAGIWFQNFNVLDVHENKFDSYAGGTLKYKFTIDGVKYEYGALCGITIDGDVFADVKAGFESLVDNAGLSIKIGAYKDENMISYRASLNANVLF